MKKIFIIAFLMTICGFNLVRAETKNMTVIEKIGLIQNVTKWKQSTILMKGERKLIYFDPYMVRGACHDADVIFITHPHSENFSIPDIQKIMKPDTILVATPDVIAEAKAVGIKEIISVIPNREYRVPGIYVQTIPAYNI